ncbi:ras-related protein Rab-36 isoform 3-T3 [Hipposideros larvatus]
MVTALGAWWDSFRCKPHPDPAPDVQDSSDARRSRVALVALVISAALSARPGRAEPRTSQAAAGLSGRMKSSLMPLGPPVSRDRIIASFPKWYTPAACLQLKEHFHGQVNATCQRRNTGTVGLNLSKVVVVGDLYVGKTSLIHRFCKNVFDRDYKATIGVDFEIERFEIAGIPYSLQMQWLEDALRENEPGSCFVFLVGTKKDLLSGAACEQAEVEAVHLANEMQAEYWSVSAKTGENVKAFFSRVAALAFEQSVLQDLERRSSAWLQEWREVYQRPRQARDPPAWVAVSWDCLRGLHTPHMHGQCLLLLWRGDVEPGSCDVSVHPLC